MSRFAFAFALVCAGPAFAETSYFAAIPDLPIAPGLRETPSGAAFNGARGDLVMAAAEGRAPASDVERFYMESLSGLGWSYLPAPRDEGLTFIRDRERLVLRMETEGGATRLDVRLIVRPVPTNAD